MRLSFDERGGVSVVRVQEEKLTYPVLLPFCDEVRQRVEGGARRLLIDFTPVRYIDSSCVSCLMELHQLVQGRGGSLRFSGMQPRLERLIAMAGVDRIVPLHHDEDEAIAAFSSPAGER
jgi:anti-anti-sigma factor